MTKVPIKKPKVKKVPKTKGSVLSTKIKNVIKTGRALLTSAWKD